MYPTMLPRAPKIAAWLLPVWLTGIPTAADASQQLVQVGYLDSAGFILEDEVYFTVETVKNGPRVLTPTAYPSFTAQAVAQIYNLLLDYDTDPHVAYEFSFDNDSDEILGASLLYRIDTFPFRGPDWLAGETLSFTLVDRNGDGASLIPALPVYAQNPGGPPILTGYRTQNGFRGIRDTVSSAGFSFFEGLGTDAISIAPGTGSQLFEFVAGPAGFADYIDSVSFPLFGDAPWNNLGIEMAFLLTPGDRVNVRGRIDVAIVPLPAPTSLLLTGLGLAGFAGHRRRNRSLLVPGPTTAQ